MNKYLPLERVFDEEQIGKLINLFDEIDINGDGTMEWEV